MQPLQCRAPAHAPCRVRAVKDVALSVPPSPRCRGASRARAVKRQNICAKTFAMRDIITIEIDSSSASALCRDILMLLLHCCFFHAFLPLIITPPIIAHATPYVTLSISRFAFIATPEAACLLFFKMLPLFRHYFFATDTDDATLLPLAFSPARYYALKKRERISHVIIIADYYR